MMPRSHLGQPVPIRVVPKRCFERAGAHANFKWGMKCDLYILANLGLDGYPQKEVVVLQSRAGAIPYLMYLGNIL